MVEVRHRAQETGGNGDQYRQGYESASSISQSKDQRTVRSYITRTVHPPQLGLRQFLPELNRTGKLEYKPTRASVLVSGSPLTEPGLTYPYDPRDRSDQAEKMTYRGIPMTPPSPEHFRKLASSRHHVKFIETVLFSSKREVSEGDCGVVEEPDLEDESDEGITSEEDEKEGRDR